MGSWSGTGQLARAVAALPGTTCVFAKNNNESIVLILVTNKQTNKEPNKMNQVPVRPQRGLVPFSKEPKEPFFSSTWDEFDQMRNQMMEKNHGFWDKVDQDMKDILQEFEKCVSQMEADMDSANAPLRPSLPSWALPEDHKKNWPMIGNCTESKERSECEVVKLETTESKWKWSLMSPSSSRRISRLQWSVTWSPSQAARPSISSATTPPRTQCDRSQSGTPCHQDAIQIHCHPVLRCQET